MYSLNTNIDALNARNATRVSSNALSESLKRLSTGIRINSAVDDSAGLIEANRLRSDSGALKESIKNANNTIAMFQIVDKALDQQIILLDSIRAKAIQASTDGQSKITREALQTEIEGLLKELDNIAKETSFGNQKLLDGTFFNKKVHVGKDSSSVLDFSFNATSSDKMGFSSYKTTDGGVRLIDDLSLTFKNTGTSNEDVTLAPFTLSTSPGKTVVDLANFVNKYSEDTGVRAIYKEGNTLPVYKKVAFNKELNAAKENSTGGADLKIPSATISSYTEKDFPVSDKIKVSDMSFSPLPSIPKTDSSIKEKEDLDYNIDFRVSTKPNVITPAGKTFYESVNTANYFDDNVLTLQLTDDEFTTKDPSANIEVSNLPDYLQANFSRADSKNMQIRIGPKAGVATPTLADTTYPVNNIGFKFTNKELFKSEVAPDDVGGFSLSYSDTPKIHLNAISNFKETSANDGHYDGKVTLQLQGGKLLDTTLDTTQLNFDLTGLAGTAQTISTSGNDKIIFEITGQETAHGENDDKVLNLVINDNAIFENGRPSNPVISTYIDFADKPTMALGSVGGFTEHSNNDGTISTSIVLRVNGDKFKDNLTETFIKNNITIDYDGADISALDIHYNKNNSNEITVTYSKNATNRTNDVNIKEIVFNSALFERGIAPDKIEDTVINFLEDPNITVSTDTISFSEKADEPGKIEGSLELGIENGKASFTATNIKDYIDVSLPDGLTPSFTIVSTQSLAIAIDGIATNHSLREEDISIGFKREAFQPNVFSTKFDSHIDFFDSAYVLADTSFKEESATNNGKIDNPVNLLLKNSEEIKAARLALANKVLVKDTDYIIDNVPTGLTAVLTIVDGENIKVELTGNATSNIDNQNISITLKGNLLKSGIDTKPVDVKVEFKKASRIVQIGEFKESAANNGKIASQVTFELTDGTFNADPIVVSKPGGPTDLVAVWTRPTANTAVLEFTGSAPQHASFHPGEVEINFKGSIVGGAGDTLGLDSYKTNIIFVDELPEFINIGGKFLENEENNGQVKGTVALELPSGMSFDIEKYNIGNPDEINAETGISLNAFLRKNIKGTNLPYILEPTYKINTLHPRQLLISFLDNADATTTPPTENEYVALEHGSSDSASFRLSFSSSLFVDNKTMNDVSLDIKFYDEPEVIAFGSFKESPRNDGSTDDYLELSVLGDKFARVNPNNYIEVKGIPNSLTPKFVTDKSSIRFYLEGKSKKHDEFDDFNNIELIFNTRLFENRIQPPSLKNIRFDFKNKPIPEIEENFQESFSNDGSIDKPITVTLKEGYFKADADPSLYANMTNIPAGLTPKYRVIDETALEITLKGNAFNHSLTESVKNSELELGAGIFASGIKPDKLGNIEINFLGSPEIKYEGGFAETESNDGGVEGAITLTLEKDTFREGLSLDNYIILGNLPAGLTPIYKFKNESTIEFTLSGKAINHTDYNDIEDLSVSFTSDLFTQKVLPSNEIVDINIDFKDSPKIFYNDYFREGSKNDGSIRNIITLDLFGDTLTSVNPNANGVITTRNLPSGLTTLFTRTKANQLTMQLLGQSQSHSKANAANNIEIEFSNQLFRNGVAPSNLEDILIDYRDRPEIFTTDKLIESRFNDGSFGEPATFTLLGDTFNGTSNPNDSIFVKNLPAGLTPKFILLNDNQIELRLEGKAISHEASSIKPELIFQDPELFFSGIAPEKFILREFNFVEAPIVKLDGPFTESFLNNGTMTGAKFLEITNLEKGGVTTPKFAAGLDSDDLKKLISISNLPSGLEPIFVAVGDKIQLTLRGIAVKHTNLYDVDNLRLEFSQELFNTKVSGNIIEDGIVNFREPPKVNTRSFVESDKNDGSMSNFIILEVEEGDKFTGANLQDNIKVISPPDGLRPVFSAIDNTHIKFELVDQADNHADIHDLDDMTLEFDPSLFESGQQADPITNLVVDFKDPPPPVIEAKENVFEEAKANDGSIEKSIDFSVKYDDLSQTYNFKYTATIENIKDIIGGGNNLIFNGVNIPDIDVDSPDFYTSIITKINNNANGTSGVFAELDGTNIKLFKDFQNTVKVEGRGGNRTINNHDEKDLTIKKELKTKHMIGHLIEVSGVPDGLTFEFTKEEGAKKLFTATLVGNAKKHLNQNDTDKVDIEDLKFKFKAGLFARNVQGKDLNDVSINFNDPTVTFSNSFKESKLDDGSIDNKVTITLFGDKFNDETDLDAFVTTKNIPKGLTPAFVRLSDTEIEMSLEGNAKEHLDEHDINNITLSFAKALFAQGLAIFPENTLSINFNDPPDPMLVPGGPGAYGGYITFISDRSSDLIIETGDADFGLNKSKFSTTLNLRDAITKNLNKKDLYGIGYTDDIEYELHQESTIRGVNHKQSSALVMDAVDSALEYIKKMRAKVASYQVKLEKRLEFLNIERTNIISAESTIREIDFAEETSKFQKRELLMRAGNYAISQANASKKMILTLLQQQ